MIFCEGWKPQLKNFHIRILIHFYITIAVIFQLFLFYFFQKLINVAPTFISDSRLTKNYEKYRYILWLKMFGKNMDWPFIA